SLAYLEETRRPGFEQAFDVFDALSVDANGTLLYQAIRRRRAFRQPDLLERRRHADTRTFDGDGFFLDVFRDFPTLTARREVLPGLLRRGGAREARRDLDGKLEFDL